MAMFGFSKLIQLSMDGPHVNWSLYDKLQCKIQEEHCISLLNVGSCGLHTLHNSFRNGYEASGWDNVVAFLEALYTLWKDCPARRADYEGLTTAAGVQNAQLWPLKFCKHRWLENVGPAQRAIELLPATRCYVEVVRNKRTKDPKTKSFDIVKNACADELILCKLSFFCLCCQAV